MDNMLFMAYDGDNAGRLVGRAILADDAHALHDASNRIEHGHDIVRDWVQQNGGQIISGGGDEGTFAIPAEALTNIENLRKDYQYATQLTMTVGVGQSLSQAGKALMAGKFRGKDQVCQYDETVDRDLAQSQAHVSDGTATEEEQKIGEAYLTPEGAPMQESELHDCEYCKESAAANVVDEDHCQYCHNVTDEAKPEAHCQYCAEADAAAAPHDPNAEGHAADCEYCAAADQQFDHEHSEENCQYCAEAAAKPDHEHTGDDCQYCAEANAQAPAPAQVPAEGDQSLQGIAQEIEQTTQGGESADQVLAQLDGPGDMPGTIMEDGTSHPENYQQNVPGDMGLAEDTVPEENPDLSQVLAGGLDNHAENIQREKVIQMAAEALQGFKGCKDILERARQQAPQLYESSIAMLRAMIEMAKMLGLSPQEAQPAPQQAAPQPSNPQKPQSNPQPGPSEGPSEGKPLGR